MHSRMKSTARTPRKLARARSTLFSTTAQNDRSRRAPKTRSSQEERPENYPSDATRLRDMNTAHAGTARLLKRSTFCFGVPMLVNSTYYHVMEIKQKGRQRSAQKGTLMMPLMDSDECSQKENNNNNTCTQTSKAHECRKLHRKVLTRNEK